MNEATFALFGYLSAGISFLCFIFAVHYNWSGPSGLFWLGMFLFGFLAAHFLAPLNRRAEGIRISPMAVAELKFRSIQRHIFGAPMPLVIMLDNR